jgi:Domain of unknown function (DUF227).
MQEEAQFTHLAERHERHVASLGSEFADAVRAAGVDDVVGLGGRLQKVARAAAAAAHPFDASSGGDAAAYAPFKTLVHGDPKAANLFIRSASAGATETEVGLIDFQWSGFGLGATDATHCICAAVDATALTTDNGEERLLDAYHAALCDALAQAGAAESAAAAAATLMPRATLQAQHEDAIIDMGRMVFAYQWSRARFGVDNLNRNSYNKNLRNAVWLAARVDALLAARGY